MIHQEACANFIAYVKDFIKQEPSETLDNQLEKLNSLKRLLEPFSSDVSIFDELAEKIKTLQDALEKVDDDEDYSYYEDYDDDSLTPHYWGGDDGHELFFYDEV